MKKWKVWSKADNIALEVVLLLALAVVAVTGVLLPVAGVLGLGDPIQESSIGLQQPEGEADPLVNLTEATLQFPDPDLGQRVLLALPWVTGGVVAAVVLWLIYRIARTVRTDPFVPANATRLVLVGATSIAGGMLQPVIAFVCSGELLDSLTPSEVVHRLESLGLPPGFTGADLTDLVTPIGDFSAYPVFFGLLTVALAEVFRRGTKLRDDTEGLV